MLKRSFISGLNNQRFPVSEGKACKFMVDRMTGLLSQPEKILRSLS